MQVAVSDMCGSLIWGPGSTLLSRVGDVEPGHLKAQDRARPQEVEKQEEVVQLKQVSRKKKPLGYRSFCSSCLQNMRKVETTTFPGAGSTPSSQTLLPSCVC